ncbi:unnamed protein product [Orchesella dallaii]|uniref:Uncharacterized protein n=1 Tax=Orchesella dallaii TaxID=48710 RepID=A0ABP1RY96_9HEXA
MDINVVNEFGETPLHKCIRGKSMECGKFQHLLITNGANVNAKNRSFRTPILDGFRCFGLSLNVIQLMEQYGLVVEKTLCANLLKLAICNLKIDFHPNFIDVPIYFIEKGALLGSQVEENPWKFESVQNDMDKIIKAAEITDEFLNQKEIRSLLTEGGGIGSTGLDRSENFFKILKEKPGSFETFFGAFISWKLPAVSFSTLANAFETREMDWGVKDCETVYTKKREMKRTHDAY